MADLALYETWIRRGLVPWVGFGGGGSDELPQRKNEGLFVTRIFFSLKMLLCSVTLFFIFSSNAKGAGVYEAVKKT